MTTNEKIRNYNGNVQFLNSLKENLAKYGSLTTKQVIAAEKVFNTEFKNIQIPQHLRESADIIKNYDGGNDFVNQLKDKLSKYNFLTERQISAGVKTIESEQNKNKIVSPNLPTIGETIKIGRGVGLGIKERYGLDFSPVFLDITHFISISPKAVKFRGKLTKKVFNVCSSCGRTLTDEFSMITGYGKKCAGHLGVEYIKDKNDLERFRQDLENKIDEIGEFEFWVPRSKLLVWDGKTKFFLKVF